jgi:hypothetical protein
VTRAFVDHFAPPMDRDRQREVADGRESVSLFNQGVHLGLSCQPGLRRAQVSTSIYVRATLSLPPLDSCETSTSIFRPLACHRGIPPRRPPRSLWQQSLPQSRRASKWVVRVASYCRIAAQLLREPASAIWGNDELLGRRSLGLPLVRRGRVASRFARCGRPTAQSEGCG